MKDVKGTAMVPRISFPYLNSAKSRCIMTTDNYYHNLNHVVDLIEGTMLNVRPFLKQMKLEALPLISTIWL